MGLRKTFGGDRRVQYLDRGGSFTGTRASKLSELCTSSMSSLVNDASIQLLRITKQCGGNFYSMCMLIDRRKTGRTFANMSIVVSLGCGITEGFPCSVSTVRPKGWACGGSPAGRGHIN